MKLVAILTVAVLVGGSIALFISRNETEGEQANLPFGRSDVVALWLEPVPEGPLSPRFQADPADPSAFELSTVAGSIPERLPQPLPQTCEIGGDVVVRVRSGREIHYGPCDHPESIKTLKKAMLLAIDRF